MTREDREAELMDLTLGAAGREKLLGEFLAAYSSGPLPSHTSMSDLVQGILAKEFTIELPVLG